MSVRSPAMNLLSGVFRDGKAIVASGKLEIRMAAEAARLLPPDLDRIALDVLVEDVVVGSGRGLEGRVYRVETHRVEKIVTLEVDEHSLKAMVPAHMALEVDSAIPFAMSPGKLQLFADQTGINLGSMKEETNHD